MNKYNNEIDIEDPNIYTFLIESGENEPIINSNVENFESSSKKNKKNKYKKYVLWTLILLVIILLVFYMYNYKEQSNVNTIYVKPNRVLYI
jgi:hypothetical protein